MPKSDPASPAEIPSNKPLAERDPQKFTARRKARLRAVELIFEAEAKGVDYSTVLSERDVLVRRDETIKLITEYARVLIMYLAEHHEQVDQIIHEHLYDWEFGRLPAVDRAVLRMAVTEMLYSDQVPIIIAVDEAVSIAKELSTDESPKFINGILGNIQKYAQQWRDMHPPISS